MQVATQPGNHKILWGYPPEPERAIRERYTDYTHIYIYTYLYIYIYIYIHNPEKYILNNNCMLLALLRVLHQRSRDQNFTGDFEPI